MPDSAIALLEQIRGTARSAAEETLARARAEAEALRTRARLAAEHLRADAVAAHERDAALALARTSAETRARLGNDTLSARAVALDRIYAAVEPQFEALAAHAGIGALLREVLAEALGYLPESAVTVTCSPAFAGAVRAAVAAAGPAAISVREDEAAPAGIRIESADRSILVDATFTRCLARERARLSARLARRLLETGTP